MQNAKAIRSCPIGAVSSKVTSVTWEEIGMMWRKKVQTCPRFTTATTQESLERTDINHSFDMCSVNPYDLRNHSAHVATQEPDRLCKHNEAWFNDAKWLVLIVLIVLLCLCSNYQHINQQHVCQQEVGMPDRAQDREEWVRGTRGSSHSDLLRAVI